jgi:hypothetical protein
MTPAQPLPLHWQEEEETDLPIWEGEGRVADNPLPFICPFSLHHDPLSKTCLTPSFFLA